MLQHLRASKGVEKIKIRDQKRRKTLKDKIRRRGRWEVKKKKRGEGGNGGKRRGKNWEERRRSDSNSSLFHCFQTSPLTDKP